MTEHRPLTAEESLEMLARERRADYIISQMMNDKKFVGETLQAIAESDRGEPGYTLEELRAAARRHDGGP